MRNKQRRRQINGLVFSLLGDTISPEQSRNLFYFVGEMIVEGDDQLVTQMFDRADYLYRTAAQDTPLFQAADVVRNFLLGYLEAGANQPNDRAQSSAP